MSDRRNKKSKSGRSPDRSRSRSAHRKKSDKQKSKKSKKYKRSYSRSSSRSRSNSSKRSRSSSKSPSQRKNYGSKYERKLEQYSPEKDTAASVPAEDEYRPEQSDSNCLVLTDLSDDITQDELQDMLQDLAISLGTSPPDSIQMVAILKTAYVMFPSVASAKKILYSLKGKLVNDKVNISMEFYPTNLTGQGQKQSKEQAQDVSLVQDWICDKCHYKNFAKRGKCNRCDNSRNQNCKVVFNSASYVKQNGPPGSGHYAQGGQGEGPQSSSSLMVRGAILQDTDETDLLDYFNSFAPVKDIRMVRNKQTGKYRDFAFIEFFSVEEAENIMNRAQEMDFRISGQPITIAYSRTKRREDEGGQGGQEETTTSPYPGYQQNRKQYGQQAAAQATQNAYGQDVNAYLQNAAAMNALDPQTAAYYQNYYQQYYGQQGAAGMQQYVQNYGQAYNYNQTTAAYGTQGYNAQNYANYANYGYNTTAATQNYATNQNYNQQQQLQQLQQQLQPSTIQQAVPTQTTQTQAQNPPQAQTILSGLGGTSSINPAVTSEKKASTEIVTEQPAAKTMEVESTSATDVVQENKGEEKTDQMVLEEKKDEGKEENKINEETPIEGGNVPTAGSEIVQEEKKVEEKKVLTKAEIEKNKRKQIELEMKKWEKEQQMKALFGSVQEEEQQQQQGQGQDQGKKVEGKTQQEGDKFAPMQVQSKQKTSIFTNVESAKNEKGENELPKKEVVSYKVFLGDVPVCKLCKRKFNDEYSIKLHEKFSTMHKENLSKVAS